MKKLSLCSESAGYARKRPKFLRLRMDFSFRAIFMNFRVYAIMPTLFYIDLALIFEILVK